MPPNLETPTRVLALVGADPDSRRHWCRRRPLLSALILFVVFAATVSAVVQFVVLPVLLPSLHAGHGLLKGTDAIGYHEIAAALASEMTRFGWSHWQLRPSGHSAAGLAAPFYALISPEPWSLIPVNSLLHALAGVIVMRILSMLTDRPGLAFAGAALWIALPSALQWVSQIGKDSYFFTGMLASLLGWILLLRAATREESLWRVVEGLVTLGAGALLTGLVRQYGLFQLEVTGILMACIALVVVWCRHQRGLVSWSRSLVILGIFGAFPMALSGLPKGSYLPDREEPMVAATVPSSGPPPAISWESPPAVVQHDADWRYSRFLPKRVDNIAKRIAGSRFGYLGLDYRAAGSMIDLDVQFYDAASLAAYLPRALQIGLLAPFPVHWVGEGHSPGGTVMRRIAGMEMAVLYPLLLVGLPLALGRWRKRPEIWMVVLFCVPLIVGYACTTPNLGSLYRFRYGFLVLLAAVGMTGLGEALLRLRSIDRSCKNS